MMNLSTHNGEYTNPTSSWGTYFYFIIKMHRTETDSDSTGTLAENGFSLVVMPEQKKLNASTVRLEICSKHLGRRILNFLQF